MRKALLSFSSSILVVACGAATTVSSSDSGAGPGDAATDTATDAAKPNPDEDPALVGPPVQSVIGRFHGYGNLLIAADGTWRSDLMGCAGGSCMQGRWTGDSKSVTLVADPDAGQESFPWAHTSKQVRSVTASVVDGKLLTVADDGFTATFRDGFLCIRSCENEQATGYVRCDKMKCYWL